MKKEFEFIDSDGNKSNDKNRFLKEYEDFWKNNPEKLEQLNEAKQRSEKYNNLQYRELEAFEFVLQQGEFKQGCEFWFRSELKEIENKGNDKNYFEFLEKRKKALKMLIPKIKKDINLYPETKENFEFWILSIEDLQNIIDANLEHLVREKKKGGTISKPKILAFNNEVIDALDNFEIIITDINKLIFENSDIQQWENLLKGNVLENPIIIKEKVTIKDFKYLIKSLQKKILKGNIYTDFERQNTFLYKGEILKAKQIQKANDNIEPKLKDKIDEIILLLD